MAIIRPIQYIQALVVAAGVVSKALILLLLVQLFAIALIVGDGFVFCPGLLIKVLNSGNRLLEFVCLYIVTQEFHLT